jgi:2-haloacid dehalogenase
MQPSAILFDAYGTLFDVHSVASLAEQLAPGRGDALSQLWRTKQIEYTQLRTLSGRYKPFDAVTRDALDYAVARLGLDLDTAARDRLMNAYASLAAFPEVKSSLRALREAGYTLGILSNGTPQMLDIAVKSAGLTSLFDHVLSIDAVRAYKTSPAAYKLGTDALARPARDILFVSSNGWDAAGAGWFGYTTFWLNRAGLPRENLDQQPDGEGASLAVLLEQLTATAKGNR